MASKPQRQYPGAQDEFGKGLSSELTTVFTNRYDSPIVLFIQQLAVVASVWTNNWSEASFLFCVTIVTNAVQFTLHKLTKLPFKIQVWFNCTGNFLGTRFCYIMWCHSFIEYEWFWIWIEVTNRMQNSNSNFNLKRMSNATVFHAVLLIYTVKELDSHAKHDQSLKKQVGRMTEYFCAIYTPSGFVYISGSIFRVWPCMMS